MASKNHLDVPRGHLSGCRRSRSTGEVVAHVAPKLVEAMQRKTPPDEAFIAAPDLNQAWPDEMLLDIAFGKEEPRSDANYIRTHFQKLLSILVYIKAEEQLAHFGDDFIDVTGGPIISDKDLPLNDEKLQRMGHLNDGTMIQTFRQMQSIFCPFIIQIPSPGGVQVIASGVRAPFKERTHINRGGYGEVTKVLVSAGHVQRHGVASSDEIFAAKKFITGSNDDFDREASKLEMLKDCLSGCRSVMVHEALIRHGDELVILFPFAKHLDLQIFLNEGKDLDEKIIYDFNARFPEATHDRPAFVGGALFQMICLANALRWLHTEVKDRYFDPVHIAHMDLKPNNILVTDDDINSPVGFWKLTDFGISADDTRRSSSGGGVVTLRGLTTRYTIHTRPHRVAGSYQAPEVEREDYSLGQADQLSPEAQGIGRRSDIWSLGCVFVEVLAFLLGRKLEVERLSRARSDGANDFYYGRKSHSSSLHPTLQAEFELKPRVHDWLSRLSERYSGEWVEIAVQTAFKTLQVEVDLRPDAEQMMSLFIEIHKNYRSAGMGPEIDSQRLQPIPSLPEHQPSIAEPGEPATLTMPLTPRHGLLIDQDRQRQALSSRIIRLDETMKLAQQSNHVRSSQNISVQALGLSPCGTQLALVTKHGGECSLLVYEISPSAGKVREKVSPIPLTEKGEWDGVAISGSYVVAWAYSKKGTSTIVRLCDLQKPGMNPTPPKHADVRKLSMVAVSSQGAVAYVCDNKIFLSQLRTYKPITLTGNGSVAAQRDRRFTDAVFNESGDILYAWAYLANQDYLYTWEVQGAEAHTKPRTEASYQSDQRNSPDCKLLPLNHIPGCIVEKHDKRYFLGLCQTTPSQEQQAMYPRHRSLPKTIASCIFGDHSMIIVERLLEWQRATIKEYQIDQSSGGGLSSQGKKICKLKTKPSSNARDSTQIRVTAEKEDFFIVVCNPDLTIEIVPVSPN